MTRRSPSPLRIAAVAALALGAAALAGATEPARAIPTPTLPRTLGAFPGCEGSGCETRGGFHARAGRPTIYRITSLSDAARRCVPARGKATGCSLRDCIEASGPRVCVFAVAGAIHTRGYTVRHPYLTIRGDSAPGMGIQLDADGTQLGGPEKTLLWIRTHDVVVRGLRLRVGVQTREDNHPFLVYPGAPTDDLHHVVIDHCSMSWANDDLGSIWTGPETRAPPAAAPRESVLSFDVFAEGLRKPGTNNSRGPLIGADTPGRTAYADQMVNIDLHHNLFANNDQRNPNLRHASVRVVNNVLLNWGSWGIQLWGGIRADVVSNLGKPGPSTQATRQGFIGVGYVSPTAAARGRQSVYLSGNRFAGGPVLGWDSPILTSDSGPVERRPDPLPPPRTGPPIMPERADDLVGSVLGPGGAGASRRLDCGGRWVTMGVRDAADRRVIGSWDEPPPRFSWPITAADVGGFPRIEPIASRPACPSSSRDNSACACADADGDGIPDYWERAFCGSPTGCDPLTPSVAPPWTNLEAYLSGLAEAP